MSDTLCVLYVDSDPLESLVDALERTDAVSVAHAEDPAAARDHLDAGDQVDAVVSEYAFPGTTGTAFLADVRAAHPDLPFVFVTDAGDERAASDAFSAGADDYFPADAEDLAATLPDRILELVESARERRETRQRARATAAATEGIGVFDAEGEYTFVNRAFADLYGLDPVDMVGNNWQEYAPTEQVTAVADEIAPTLRETGYWSGTTVGEREDGDRFRAQVSLTRLDDGSTVFVVRDVTEAVERERELEETKQRLEAIVEASPVAIYVLDTEGHVERCNRAAEEMFGWSEPEIRGEHLPTVQNDSEGFEEHLAAVLSGDEVLGKPTTRLTKSGEELAVRLFAAPVRSPDGEVTGVLGMYEDVSDARERQARLAQSEERYRTLVEMSPDPIVVHRDGEVVYANETFADFVDARDPEQVVGTPITTYLAPSEHADARETARATQRGERHPTSYRRVVRTLSGGVKYIATTSRPISYEGEPSVLTIVKDRTDRRRYERALATLHEYTREMLRADDAGSAAEIAVEAVDELLDLPGGAAYGFDEEANVLTLLAASDDVAGAIASFETITPEDDSLVWNAFVEGTTEYATDLQQWDSIPEDVPIEGVLVVPVGTHGAFVTAWADGASIPEPTVELFEILGSNLEVTLDRIHRREAIEERDQRLARQARELRRVNHLNTVIREINESLLDATTNEEVERAVCAELADTEAYSFAWFGHREHGDEPVAPSTDSGTVSGMTDWIRDTPPNSPLRTMVTAAIREGEPQSTTAVLSADDWSSERSAALKYNFRSVAAVPVDVGDGTDRVLVVHGVENDAFSDRELAVFDELGRIIAATMRATGHSGGQLIDTRTEIELDVADERLLLNRLSAVVGVPITLVGAIPQGDQVVGFLSTRAGPEEMEAAVDEMGLVDSIECLASRDEENLYEVEGPTTAFFETLSEYDAHLGSMTAEDGVTTVVVTLPGYLSVRSFVEAVQAEYPDADLRARRERDVPAETPLTFRDAVEEACTDRQYQALQAAYFGGFYDWPRAATNEELAEVLGISSPTYQSHRRAAERKLVERVFRDAD